MYNYRYLSNYLITLLLLISCYNVQATVQTCRALALRGGGTKGAYEVGVLMGFINNLKPEDYRYDVVVGVSIGAINAAVIALHAKGEEIEAAKELKYIWTTYSS